MPRSETLEAVREAVVIDVQFCYLFLLFPLFFDTAAMLDKGCLDQRP